MSYKWRPCLLLMPALLLATADEAWKDKQIAEWSEADAKQVLSDSPLGKDCDAYAQQVCE